MDADRTLRLPADKVKTKTKGIARVCETKATATWCNTSASASNDVQSTADTKATDEAAIESTPLEPTRAQRGVTSNLLHTTAVK